TSPSMPCTSQGESTRWDELDWQEHAAAQPISKADVRSPFVLITLLAPFYGRSQRRNVKAKCYRSCPDTSQPKGSCQGDDDQSMAIRAREPRLGLREPLEADS